MTEREWIERVCRPIDWNAELGGFGGFLRCEQCGQTRELAGGEGVSGLTEFLLARIAEDQAEAEAVVETLNAEERDREQRQGTTEPPEWLPVPTAWDYNRVERSAEYPHAEMSGARLLAECVAKRRIVKPEHPDEWDEIARYDQGAHEAVLRLLALPYADHPSYDSEWKP